MNPAAPLPTLPEHLGAAQWELTLRRLADDLTTGTDASRFLGPGIDYAQSRLYQPGDPIKSIDWRTTARAGRVHVKAFQSARRSGLHVLLDASASMRLATAPVSKLQAALWIGAALALVGIRRRSPVGLWIAGLPRASAALCTPTLDRARLWATLDAARAAIAKPPSALATLGQPPLTLANALDELAAADRSIATVLVLADMHEPDAWQAAARVAQRHDLSVLQLADPGEGRPLRAGFVLARQAESDTPVLLSPGTTAATFGTPLGQRPDFAAAIPHTVINTADPGRVIIAQVRRLLSAGHARRAAR